MSQDNKPLFVTNPEVWLQKENEAHAFVCIVIFRDSWCKFDKHHLTALGKHNESHMKQEQVYLIAWTSEGAEGAAKTDAEWNLHMSAWDTTKFLETKRVLLPSNILKHTVFILGIYQLTIIQWFSAVLANI